MTEGLRGGHEAALLDVTGPEAVTHGQSAVRDQRGAPFVEAGAAK